jgi:cytoskeletal protein CcmA (bactofilin family)
MAVFSQKKYPEPNAAAQTPVVPVTQSSLMGNTLVVKGEIYSEDEMVIEGRVQGKITVKNRVVIGRGGIVEAEIDAREIIIKGKVTGNVRGSQRVEIVPAGILHGNIQAPRVVIADSGLFEGNIEMRAHEEKGKAAEEKGKVAEEKPANSQSHGNGAPAPQKSNHK